MGELPPVKVKNGVSWFGTTERDVSPKVEDLGRGHKSVGVAAAAVAAAVAIWTVRNFMFGGIISF